MEKRIVLFDICGTLFQSNTTFDFLNYTFSDNRSYKLFKRIYQSLLWRVFNRFLREMFDCDLTRVIALRYLRGIKRDGLITSVIDYYDGFLSSRENTRVVAEMKEALCDERCRVILLSATIDVVAEVIAHRLGCKEYYSTQLKYIDGVCTGKIQKDLLGKKIEIIKKLDLSNSINSFYTDDLTDIAVLETANKKNIVLYPQYRKKWGKIIAKRKWTVRLLEM